MEEEDLEERNNEDCGQRARRLATLIKEEKTKGQGRKQTCVSVYTSHDIIFTVHVVPRPNSSSA